MSEANFRFQNEYTPDQIYSLVLIAIKAAGPLNRPARQSMNANVIGEMYRLGAARVFSALRRVDFEPDVIQASVGWLNAIEELGFREIVMVEDSVREIEALEASSEVQKGRKRPGGKIPSRGEG